MFVCLVGCSYTWKIYANKVLNMGSTYGLSHLMKNHILSVSKTYMKWCSCLIYILVQPLIYVLHFVVFSMLNMQVYYKFNSLAMLMEPLMLISGFLFLFVAGIVCIHVDLSISKSSASYLAKLQWDEVSQFLNWFRFCNLKNNYIFTSVFLGANYNSAASTDQ